MTDIQTAFLATAVTRGRYPHTVSGEQQDPAGKTTVWEGTATVKDKNNNDKIIPVFWNATSGIALRGLPRDFDLVKVVEYEAAQ